jgi:outer membrane protein
MLLAVITGASVRAENLTLQDAIRVSLENNNVYLIALEQAEESRFRVHETWGALWPTLSTDFAYTRQDAEAGFSSRVAGQYDIRYVTGTISINPGVFYNTLQASRKAYVVSEHEVRRIKAETIITTIKLYYSLILARESIKLREESLKALQENLKVITIGYRKGTFSKLDFLRAKVAYSNERTKHINAENDFLSARAALNIHMGREIDAAVPVNEDVLVVDTSELSAIPFDEKAFIGEMIGESLRNRPEVIQITMKREIESHSAYAAASIYLWPSFFITGNYGTAKVIPRKQDGRTTTTGDPQTDAILELLNESMKQSYSPSGWNTSWSITLGATYRWGALSPADPSHAQRKQYRSRERQEELRMQDFIRAVRLEVQNGFLKLKSAKNSIESQKGNIETAEESLRVSIIQFRNGIIDNTKLLEANVELTTAKTLYIQALYDYQVAKAELNRAIGKDYFTFR